MQVRRNSQLDERRRRVLVDEVVTAPSTDGPPSRSKLRGGAARRAYTDAALADRQPRITDLLPLRPWVLLALFLSGLAALAGLTSLHMQGAWLAGLVGADAVRAVQLNQPGTLGAWFSSLTLMIAAAVCLLTFTLRRHKLDDYRGVYRIWMWAAGLCTLASIDATAGLRHLLGAALARATSVPLGSQGSAWWLIAWVAAVGVLAVRLVLEMRPCRLSVGLLALAGVSYGSAACLQLVGPTAVREPLYPLVLFAATGLGHWLLTFALTLNVRHVYLDAQGLVAAPRRRAPRPSSARSGAAPAQPTAPPDSATTRAPAARPADPRGPSDDSDDSSAVSPSIPSLVPPLRARGTDAAPSDKPLEDELDEDDQYGDMSRSERKRLRKLKRRHRHAA